MAPPSFACAECGSTAFFEDAGIWWCQHGHAQEGGQQIGQDDDDYARAGKVRYQKVVKEKQKIVKVYRGAKGFQLYLKAWQHILWKQSYALIHQHGLPTELWDLVRELWALWLSKLVDRFEDSTDVAREETSEEIATSESDAGSSDDNRPELPKTSRSAGGNPTLPDTISLNYIGILLLHNPTTLATLYKHIRQEKLCYIRAIRQVPQEIKDHLAPEYHNALDTIVVPVEQDIQHAIYRHITMYTHTFNMAIPPVNWRLVLFGHIKDLALPIEIFHVVKSLAKLLDFRFAYPQQHLSRRNATTYPDAQLMALMVVATKLVYPFDSHVLDIAPESTTEPAMLRMDWQAWLEAKEDCRQKNENNKLLPEEAIEVTDRDVLNMQEEKLDQYMDWFQRTYSNEIKVEQVQKQILDMFPLQEMALVENEGTPHNEDQHRDLERVRATQAALQPQRAVPPGDERIVATNLIRPGQQYQRYRCLEDMVEAASSFHQEAAKLACMDVAALLRACLRVERLLLSHQHEQRRMEYFEDEVQ